MKFKLMRKDLSFSCRLIIIFLVWQEEDIEKADQLASELGRRREREHKSREHDVLRKIVRLTYSC